NWLGGRAKDAERRSDMDIHHRLELLVRHLLDDVVPHEARVVDDDVQSTEAIERRLDESLGEAVGDDAAVARYGMTARGFDGSDGFAARAVVEIVDHDAGAIAGQLQRDRASDASPGSGDEGDLAIELHRRQLETPLR